MNLESIDFSIRKVKPKSKGQRACLKSIEDNTVTAVFGAAGTGKTFLSTATALQHLADKRVEKIILCRPLIQCGDMGYLKGSLQEKIMPFMSPLLEEAINLTDKSFIDMLVERGFIQIVPLELMRGMNFHKTFMILDEANNADYGQLKMFLTRIGRGSKCCLVGDTEQTDIGERNAASCDYQRVIDRIRHIEGVGSIKLGIEDIVRSDIVGKVLTVL